MKLASVSLAVCLVLCAAITTRGQDRLESNDARQIVEELVSRRLTTWLPAGTVQAKHQRFRAARVTNTAEVDAAIQREIQGYEADASKLVRTEELQKDYLDAIPFNTRYQMANEYNMTSNETVEYDGSRFSWKVSVTSRSDSVRPGAELAGNPMVERFDLAQNKERTFTWDGQQYTIYSASANHVIADTANRLPREVNGPLTAGLVPWGQGLLSSSNISAAEITATDTVLDGTKQIEVTITPSNGAVMVFVLDPAMDYAVTFCTLTSLNNAVQTRYLSGYRNVAGHWVPSTILIEKHDVFTDRLLASDKWDLTVIEATTPGAERFVPAYRADTVVEYYSPVSTKASIYHYSNATDTDALLATHLGYIATRAAGRQNCATVALQHASTQLGKPVPDSALAGLVGADGLTSLADLARVARGLGLYYRAVRTDLATLSELPACQAILHIPGKNHFVVLDHVDERNAWLVDLSSSTFYYRKDKAFLPMDWQAGTALLLSRRPIDGAFDDLDPRTLTALSGGAGYSCTRLIQEDDYILCVGTTDDCWGTFKFYWKRWGCEYAPSGSCPTEPLARYTKDDCIWDPVIGCTTEGNWQSAYITACD